MKRHRLFSCFFFLLCCLQSAQVVAQSDQHTVKPGDTVYSIARAYKVPLTALQSVNDFKSETILKVGQKVTIPKTYQVKAGDTVFGLARGWKVEQKALLAINRLKDAKDLKVGSWLVVPHSTEASESTLAVAQTVIKTQIPGSRTAPPPLASQTETTIFWPVASSPQKRPGDLNIVAFSSPDMEFKSVCDGTVLFVGEYSGLGKLILIQNPKKIIYGFGKISENVVKFGETVRKGQVLGRTGKDVDSLIFFSFKEGISLDPFLSER